MAGFVFGWKFFVRRRICSSWAWYFRHFGGVLFGIIFAVIVCLGVIGVVIVLPAEIIWSSKYVVELFVIDMLIFTCSWLLARQLFPAMLAQKQE